MYSIGLILTTVGLILTKLRRFLFSEYKLIDGQTDTIPESSYGNMSAHKKFPLNAQNYELAVDRYMHSRGTGMYKY